MISNWTWEQLVQETSRLRPEIQPETASCMGLDPKTGLAWFKVAGTRQVTVIAKAEGLFPSAEVIEFHEDWVMIQLPGSHAIDEEPTALTA